MSLSCGAGFDPSSPSSNAWLLEDAEEVVAIDRDSGGVGPSRKGSLGARGRFEKAVDMGGDLGSCVDFGCVESGCDRARECTGVVGFETKRLEQRETGAATSSNANT
jgi:hypothetical protein